MKTIFFICGLFLLGIRADLQAPAQKISIDSVDLQAPARELETKTSTNQIFVQEMNPATGQNEYKAYGPPNMIPGNPKTGEPDMLPPNSLTAIIGQTPLHTNYQVLHYPNFRTTPLNLESYPRIYTPQFSPQHPFNLHHPFNYLYGMHPYMFTGDPSSAGNLFMNPFAHAQTGMFGTGSMFPTANALGASQVNLSTAPIASNNAAPSNPEPANNAPAGTQANPLMNSPLPGSGFNPLMGGVGPFGAGFGAFNPSMASLGPWPYLSPMNSGFDSEEMKATTRKLRQRLLSSTSTEDQELLKQQVPVKSSTGSSLENKI